MIDIFSNIVIKSIWIQLHCEQESFLHKVEEQTMWWFIWKKKKKKKICDQPSLWSAFHFLKTFLHQKSNDVDLFGFSVWLWLQYSCHHSLAPKRESVTYWHILTHYYGVQQCMKLTLHSLRHLQHICVRMFAWTIFFCPHSQYKSCLQLAYLVLQR